MLSRSASAKLQQSEWNCHCCTAKNVGDAIKCRVCGRPESYALQGYGLPFHGKNSTLFRPTQILTVIEDIHEVDSELWSALHSACASGNYPVVRDLLALKAKFETTTSKGQTPLHLAVYSGSLDCVNELLKYGADPNISTIHEKCTPLHLACQKGFAQIAVALVDHGARVDVLNVLSRTPLHMAAEAGRVDIGNYLLSRGADRNALDVHGWSCRQIAELFQHRDFQELMIREGMVEKQIIIKELPEAEWHSDLWFDVTRMHAARKEELRVKNETTASNHALLASLQKNKKDEIIAQRRAERQIEIKEYYAQKNLAKEMAQQYTEKLSVSRQPKKGKINNLLPATGNDYDSKPPSTAIVKAVAVPSHLPSLSLRMEPESESVLRVNTAEKVRSPLPRSRGTPNETDVVSGYTRNRPVSRISFAAKRLLSWFHFHSLRTMISVKVSDIPLHLHGSGFYRSLQLDTNDSIALPELCYKGDVTIKTKRDCLHFLHTIRFWCVDVIPACLLEYLMKYDMIQLDSLIMPFVKELTYLNNIKIVRAAAPALKSALAVRSGKPEILEYLMSRNMLHGNDLCEIAAEQSSSACLSYLHERGFPWTVWTCTAAAAAGSLDCLQYAHTHGCPWDADTCAFSASNGHLDCLKYAHEHHCPWDEGTCASAAASGSLACLRYAHEKGCPWDADSTQHASFNGHLSCLQYLHEEGCVWNKATCHGAARNGHLHCLQYAHEHNCPWDAYTCTSAAGGGHLNCLVYAHEHGCEWDINTHKASLRHPECREYVEKHGCPLYLLTHGTGERSHSCMYTCM